MITRQNIRDFLAKHLARLLRRFVHDPRYFDLWESHGYHLIPTHYYSAVPDTREITPECFSRLTEMVGIELNADAQLDLLSQVSRNYRPEYESFARTKEEANGNFYFGNGAFESVDAEMLYGIVRSYKPQRIVEIGSGYSTMLAVAALHRNAIEGRKGLMTAIEPYPPQFLKDFIAEGLEHVVQRVQYVPMALFESLGPGDIVFIDSSHVCKFGSDVAFEFLEILPRLRPGVLVHVHDIFLPEDYPREWVMDWHRFWNEQYFLQAFLCSNRDYEIVWAGAWMNYHHASKLRETFPSYVSNTTKPASFWIRRVEP